MARIRNRKHSKPRRMELYWDCEINIEKKEGVLCKSPLNWDLVHRVPDMRLSRFRNTVLLIRTCFARDHDLFICVYLSRKISK